MLRSIFLSCFFVLSVNVGAQMFSYFGYQEFMFNRDTGNLAPVPLFFKYGYWLPVWSDNFGEPTVSKLLIESKALNFTKPVVVDIQISIPYVPRPYEVVGSDGLPGIPLPAIHNDGLNIRDIREIRRLMLKE